MNKKLAIKLHGDRTIWTIVMLLLLISILAVYSSSAALAFRHSNNSEIYIHKHILIIICGTLIMYLVHMIPYKWFSIAGRLSIWLAIPLLLYTLLKGNSGRWIELSIPFFNQSFQPSDLAKLALILYLARTMSVRRAVIKDFKQGFLPLVIPAVIISAEIFPSNFSTSALILVITTLMLYVGGAKLKHLLLLIGVSMVAFSIFYFVTVSFSNVDDRFQTWENRINGYIHGDESSNYQASQAKMAIASGGAIGKLPGNSTMRNFLPQAHNDFIYAIIIEEYGLFLGGIFPVLLYLTLLFRGIQLYLKTDNYFGSYLVMGITLSLFLQASINMGVAVGLFPVTGQAMPLVSMGGTSIWFTCISIGIVLSISNAVEKESKKKEANETSTIEETK